MSKYNIKSIVLTALVLVFSAKVGAEGYMFASFGEFNMKDTTTNEKRTGNLYELGIGSISIDKFLNRHSISAELSIAFNEDLFNNNNKKIDKIYMPNVSLLFPVHDRIYLKAGGGLYSHKIQSQFKSTIQDEKKINARAGIIFRPAEQIMAGINYDTAPKSLSFSLGWMFSGM